MNNKNNAAPACPENARVVRFHARNALAVFIILIGMVAAFFMLLAAQYEKSEKLANESLNRRFMERVACLDSLLKQVTDHLQGMRRVAEADMFETRMHKEFGLPVAYQFIHDSGQSFFHMDDVAAPLNRQTAGNLTGDGRS